MSSPPIGVYVHWPWCARVCPYCDFNVRRDRGEEARKTALLEAMLNDLAVQASVAGPRRLVSIYLGGGTPSLMDPAQAERLVSAARRLWNCEDDIEVTLEANPTDVEAARFADFAAAGVTRVSLGIQSLRDPHLRFLGRNHNAAAARRAAEIAARTFRRLSIDLIYALPAQDQADWAAELREVVALGAEHLSAYQLTIEAGTAFSRAVARGALVPPGEETAADFFETTQRVLIEAGFHAYEVSNHARTPAARSRHNLLYWRGEDYIGVGPGAHGRLTLLGQRWELAAPRGIDAYITAAHRRPGRTRLEPKEAALERMLMGLRTDEGVSLQELAPLAISRSKLETLARSGLASIVDDRLIVGHQGRLVLDRITLELAHGA